MHVENLKIYNQARLVPEEAQKPIQAGRLKGMTDINPMWRIKRLTELFGPCGIGWWYEIVDKRIEEDGETKQKAAFVDVLLFYKDPDTGETSRGIPGTGGAAFVSQERNGPYLSDECYKMALTDALSVAAKAIGVAADVYYAKDRDKYTVAPDEPQAPTQMPEYICEECGHMLKDMEMEDGIKYRMADIARRSKKLYGRTLCPECSARLKNENR